MSRLKRVSRSMTVVTRSGSACSHHNLDASWLRTACSGEDTMEFSNQRHQFDCGIDLHVNSIQSPQTRDKSSCRAEQRTPTQTGHSFPRGHSARLNFKGHTDNTQLSRGWTSNPPGRDHATESRVDLFGGFGLPGTAGQGNDQVDGMKHEIVLFANANGREATTCRPA